jgi:hypothetical protein
MVRRLDLTAAKLVTLFVAGTLLAASSFPLISLFAPIHVHNNVARFLGLIALSFAPMLIGFYITFTAQKNIEIAIADERWPESEVLPFRVAFESGAWKLFVAVLFVCMLIAAVISFSSPARHYRGAYWAVLIVIQNITRLPTAFREPKPTPPPTLTPTHPLQSTHWGSR